MSYIEDTLGKDEQVLQLFKVHRVCYINAIILIFPGCALIIPAIIGVFQLLRLWNLEQGVTNKKVIVKHGILSRKTDEMRSEKIEHVNIDQGILGRICGYGDVIVRGTGGGIVKFRFVADPLKVKVSIDNALHVKD